jgi:glycerophosphoryl diester phosphodiesterase
MRDRPRTIGDFLQLGGRPRVIAHRGFSGKAPQNTLAACRAAIALDTDMIEIDVLLSRDGEVVVIHDPELTQTTNGVGRVGDHPLAELQRLDAGTSFSREFSGEPIPTLNQILDLVRGRTLLNVEIKQEAVSAQAIGGITHEVLRAIHHRGMSDQVILSSFDPRALSHARQLAPEVKTASLFNATLHAGMGPREVMDEVGSVAFNVSDTQITPAILRACHHHGCPVAVYTVNEPSRMRALFRLGVDALFTDRPDLMLGVLGETAFATRGWREGE